MTQGIDNGA